MKLSTNWLKEYIDFDLGLRELAEKLTMAGLEVEEMFDLDKNALAQAGGAGLEKDSVFDVKITPNRGDWLSVTGVAREVGGIVGEHVKLPEPKIDGAAPASSEMIDIRIDDPDLCHRYTGVVIRGVEIKESPGWMKDRLIAAGMRPINNVVDITNYVMLELGQPLHAFDYNLLRGKQIIVRRAKAGESITAIDEVERVLEPDMLVIADADRAVAIAGVMGGVDSEISEKTKDILIESANFNSVSIRRTSKRLSMVTESSYRFERTVDPNICAVAALRAAELIRDLAGGEVAEGIVDVYPVQILPVEITARPGRVNGILGCSIESDEMARYLNSIDIDTRIVEGALVCKVPTFRTDVTREIDIVEEVGRVMGYDKLETTLPSGAAAGHDSHAGAYKDRIRQILMRCGSQEVLTHSVVDSRITEAAGRGACMLRIRNPLTEDLDSMRAALLPNLFQVIGRNQAFGTPNICVFEVGKVYFDSPDHGIGEKLSVAGSMVGSLWQSAWSLPSQALDVDFFLCKGTVENLLRELGIQDAVYVEANDTMLHPTRTARIMVGERELGIIGEISSGMAEALDVRGRACGFEIEFDTLMEITPEVLKASELPRYPALYRHINAVVAEETSYLDLAGAVDKSGGDIVERVELLDIYKGEQVGAGKRSVTLSIVFRAQDRTLKDEEVNNVLAEVKEALVQRYGADFR